MNINIINFYKKLRGDKKFSIEDNNGFRICGILDITDGEALNTVITESL